MNSLFKTGVVLMWLSLTLHAHYTKATYAGALCNSCSSSQAEWWCRLRDNQLYKAALNSWLPFGSQGCRIVDTSSCATCACNDYVKSYTSGEKKYDGWPRASNNEGTGCVKSDSGRFCYFNDRSYDLTTLERRLMRPKNSRNNALAHLRHSFCNTQCGI